MTEQNALLVFSIGKIVTDDRAAEFGLPARGDGYGFICGVDRDSRERYTTVTTDVTYIDMIAELSFTVEEVGNSETGLTIPISKFQWLYAGWPSDWAAPATPLDIRED